MKRWWARGCLVAAISASLLGVASSERLASLRSRGRGVRQGASGSGGGDDAAHDVEAALRRVAAVEDLRTSHPLCRVKGVEGQAAVAVRLQPATNTRTLVFNDDELGFETRVRCEGQPSKSCLNGLAAVRVVDSVEQCLECPCSENPGKLYGPYAVATAGEVDGRCRAAKSGAPVRVLLLGLGGGEVATHIARSCGASADIEAVELDGRLPTLARRYFGLPASVRVTVGDAGARVAELRASAGADPQGDAERRYDVVLVDCFADGGVTPVACRSEAFVQGLFSLLRGDGLVIHHLWHDDNWYEGVREAYEKTTALYRQTFHGCAGCQVSEQQLEGGPDSLVFARRGPASAE